MDLEGKKVIFSRQDYQGLDFWKMRSALQSRGAKAKDRDEIPDWFEPAFAVASEGSPLAESAEEKGVECVTPEELETRFETPLPNFAHHLKSQLAAQREGGEVLHLHFGDGASDELIEKVEKEKLGFPMPAAMRSLYKQANGFSFIFSSTPNSDRHVFEPDVPLDVPHQDYVKWYEFAGDPSDQLFVESTIGQYSDRSMFYAGIACFLPLEEMFFEHDWENIRYGRDNFYLLDYFHHYHDAALVVDKEAEDVNVVLTSDHGVDFFGIEPLTFREYTEQIIGFAGTDRRTRRHDNIIEVNPHTNL